MTRIVFLLLIVLLALVSDSAHAERELIFEHDAYQLASDGERLYASTEHGIYFSLDDGATWYRSNFNYGVAALVASPDAVYAFSDDHGILRSDTKGNTWHPINIGLKTRWWWNGKFGFRYPAIEQIFVASSGMVVAIGYLSGTWTSLDRGDSWHEVADEWAFPSSPGYPDFPMGNCISSMGEFDGYLWLQCSSSPIARSPDQGATWERIPDQVRGRAIGQFDRANVWISFKGNLYAAGRLGFGRWREEGLEWDYLSRGLPDDPKLSSLAVHRNRIFAGSWNHGVLVFDHHSETWYRTELSDMAILDNALVSHRGKLYFIGLSDGRYELYRANLQLVTPANKNVVTWGAIKLGNTK